LKLKSGYAEERLQNSANVKIFVRSEESESPSNENQHICVVISVFESRKLWSWKVLAQLSM